MISRNYRTFLEKSKKKKLFSELKSIQGINQKAINKIALLNGKDSLAVKLSEVKLDFFNKIKDQSDFYFDLEKNKIFNNVSKKKRLKSYVGMRHILKLPVKGQRTHTNSKTARRCLKKEI